MTPAKLWTILLAGVYATLAGLPQGSFTGVETAERHHDAGVDHHLRRSLDDASREYALALRLDPPRDLTPDEQGRVRRFAPRIRVTPTEFFALRDFAAVLHPERRLIAYHLFWADDIDFPEDNDPCDHELMWVRYSEDGRAIEGIWTYFHGRILEGGEPALLDARQHGMRPRINVQWGKHGSMPVGWEQIAIAVSEGDVERKYLPAQGRISLSKYNEATFTKLRMEGRRLIDSPLARRLGWPERFAGSWADFINYSRVIEPLEVLERTQMTKVSRWNSATINQHFLGYNFRPKTEWPVEKAGKPADGPLVAADTLEAFGLPPKRVFDRAMPRYPNAWFYIDAALASDYQAAVRLVTGRLRTAMKLREFYGPFDNPEGCDFETRLEHLQPWEDSAQPALQHAHAFHMRYYSSALIKQKLERINLQTPSGERAFYRFAASVHYEVEHSNPNHADVELCPVCGRTGDYKDLRGNLVELVHDPLGLELLLNGTIRGEIVRVEEYDQREVGSVRGLTSGLRVQQLVFPAGTPEQNTLRIGVIVIAPQ
jgi:hypothetical protein